jgi:AcrR family transcriptional regulator
MAQKSKNEIPKERLLDAAEALFAQKGYHAVTVRELTTAAQCNLAAVNYHFGNKKNLYVEVFRSRWVPRAQRLQESFRQYLAGQDPSSLGAVVRALAQAFLEGPLSDEERQRHAQLMTREMSQPTVAFDLVANQVMRPFIKELADRFRPFMPKELPEERLVLNIMSIIFMVIHFNFARAAVSQITGRKYNPPFKARLVEHIVQFSLKGVGMSEKEEYR